MKKIILLAFVALSGPSCTLNEPVGEANAEAQSPANYVSEQVEIGRFAARGSLDTSIWVDKQSGSSVIIGTFSWGGIAYYSADGTLLGKHDNKHFTATGLLQDVPLAGRSIDLIVAFDSSHSVLRFLEFDAQNLDLQSVARRDFPSDFEVRRLCMYRSPSTDKTYAFVLSNDGLIRQLELFEDAGQIDARQVRFLPVGSGVRQCAVDNRSSTLYISESSVGLFKIAAEPESDPTRQVVALVSENGPFPRTVHAISVVSTPGGSGRLLASDPFSQTIQLFDLRSSAHVGEVSIVPGDASSRMAFIDDIEAVVGLQSQSGGGALIVLADNNFRRSFSSLRQLHLADSLIEAQFLPSAEIASDSSIARSVHRVAPVVETDPVATYGDSADDPAIWVHPDDPRLSLVIGTEKLRGLNVYDINGKLIQSLADGHINNVDLRYGFKLGDKTIDVVAASNRSNDSIGIYAIDPQKRRLFNISDGLVSTDMKGPYGLCMYRNPKSGKMFVFVSDSNGRLRQYELHANENGRVGANLVRELKLSSKSEGCVVDDYLGLLYVTEEEVGIWRFGAEPGDGEARTSIDIVGENGLTADLEGISLYRGDGDSGYLIVSSQGSNEYAIYNRTEGNAYIGRFRIVSSPLLGIDGTSDTDGLDVTSAAIGELFPEGMLVVQDGRNITPQQQQNFKFVSWQQVAAALELD